MNKLGVILEDHPEAAAIRTVIGWVSRNGRFYGDDERLARYDGSTHRRCGCGEVVEKNGWCRKCHSHKLDDQYVKMPVVPWDGTTPLNLWGTDTYFFDSDDILGFLEEREMPLADLKLVICSPVYATPVDPVDQYQGMLPGGVDLPAEIVEAFSVLNDAIWKCTTPLCWEPGDTAVDLGRLEEELR